MPFSPSSRRSGPAGKRRDGRNRRGILVAVGVTTLCIAIVCFADIPSWLVEKGPILLQSAPVLREARAATGAIFFTTMNNDNCHEYLFDNTNGRRRDNGLVDCATAITQLRRNDNTARLNAINESFKSK
jgi:hypothetical protein